MCFCLCPTYVRVLHRYWNCPLGRLLHVRLIGPQLNNVAQRCDYAPFRNLRSPIFRMPWAKSCLNTNWMENNYVED